MKLPELVTTARDAITVRRVFAEPYEKDGVTVITAAIVAGGAGGRSGHDDRGREGEGGGFGVRGAPAGGYIIKDGRVSWRPAVDVNRLFATVGAVTIVYLLHPNADREGTRKGGGTHHLTTSMTHIGALRARPDDVHAAPARPGAVRAV